MDESFAVIYASPRLTIEKLSSLLAMCSLEFEHPELHVIYRLAPYGTRVETSISEIADVFGSDGDVTCLAWQDSSSQVYVRFRRLSEQLIAVEYEVGSYSQIESVAEIIKDLFHRLSDSGMLAAVVIDKRGETDVRQWDDYLLSGYKRTTRAIPSFLAVPLGRSITQSASDIGKFVCFESDENHRICVWRSWMPREK